jgi:hypothetical protein
MHDCPVLLAHRHVRDSRGARVHDEGACSLRPAALCVKSAHLKPRCSVLAFDLVPVTSHRLVLLSCCGLAWAVSCAVFPDEAVLPSNNSSGLGGAGADGRAGAAGDADLPAGGRAGAGMPDAGAAGLGAGGAGGLVEPPGGAAGSSVGGCSQPDVRVIPIRADTWIEAAKPKTVHANDKALFVTGGAAERRALLSLTLPGAPAGATLERASLDLQVESNADATSAERSFTLYSLQRQFVEGQANWDDWSNATDGEWDTAGGDLGEQFGSAELPAGTAAGTLSFDVRDALASAFSTQSVPLSLIVIEAGLSPEAPAEVAFTSSEGDDSKRPSLVIEFCMP